MTGQTANKTDFPPMIDVIWFDESDAAHYGYVVGWGIGMVVIREGNALVPITPDALYYF